MEKESRTFGLLIGLDDQENEGVQAPAARHGGQNNPPEVFIIELANFERLQNLTSGDAETKTGENEASEAVVDAQNKKTGFVRSHVDDVRFGDLD